MKPVKLIMSAFGSYAGEEIIDFRQADQGVFLITGDTGAGKTTIFDAITYALFDQASGGKREGAMMRSQYAGPQTPTFVEFTFTYQEASYKIRRNPSYQRISKRKNKEGKASFTTEGASVSLTMPDGREYPGRGREINEKITEILGMGKEQFTQVAMIAQGEFIRLLHASSRDRKEIFARIFDTGVYGRLQTALREKSKSLYGKLEDNKKLCLHEIEGVHYQQDSENRQFWEESRELLETKPNQILDSLGKLLAEQQSQEKSLQQQEQEVRKRQEEKRFQIRRAQEINNLFAQAEEADGRIQEREELLDNLQLQERQEEKKSNVLEQQCQEQLPVFTERLAEHKALLPKYERLQRQAKQAKEAEEQKKTLERKLEKQQKEISDLELSAAQLEESREALARDTEQLPSVIQKEQELSGRRELLEEMARLEKSWRARKEELREGQGKLQEFLTVYQEKSGEHDRRYRIFIEGQAGFLAKGLLPDQPCPVCGSRQHPRKAEFSGETVTRQELELAKEQREQADQNLQRYRDEFQNLQEECQKEQALLFRDGQRLLGEEFKTSMIKAELAECKKRQRTAKKELDLLKDKEELRKKQQQILEQTRETLRNRKEKLEDLKEKQYAAALIFETEQRAFQALQQELPHKTEQETRRQLEQMEREKQELESRQAVSRKNLQKLRESIALNQGTLEEQRKNREQMAQALKGKEYVDLTLLTEQEEQLKQAVQELEKKKRSLTSSIDRNREAKKHLSALFQQREKLKEQYCLVGNLDRTANGTLAQHVRMDLQTYVQRRYFKFMIREANRRLIKMNGEQFFLQCRELENLGKQGEVGLDLDVYDLAADKNRDVKTLSGGESFLAALAMALGMADVIQKTAGSVHLDTMFIDEGFGSLDQEARSRAIGMLKELAGETRLVGIISHVTELKEQMDRKLIISKDGQGSHACWEWESGGINQ